MGNPQILPLGEPPNPPSPSQTTPRHLILLVEDDSDVRQLSVDVLTGDGYEVEVAKDGAAGWEALQTKRYDLLITDNQMPRMTGLEMIEQVRSASMTIPVIMATGALPTSEFAKKPWLRPNAMLQRPFSNAALRAAVKKVLRATDDPRDKIAAQAGATTQVLREILERPGNQRHQGLNE